MRMTKKKKAILDILGADGEDLKAIEFEIGKKPFDVSGISYLLHGHTTPDKERINEISTLRTLKTMVRDGQIESFKTVEEVFSLVFKSDSCRRKIWKFCLPGESAFKFDVRDKDFIDGECEVLNVETIRQ